MARNLMRPLFPRLRQTAQAADILLKLYRVFSDGDCSLAEINPLAVTPAGKVLALDAQVILDDNADFPHKDWETWRDPAEETPGARLAREKGLSYVKLDGDIGCIVNGAASPWPRWTSSSTTAASPRTSSTSAVVQSPRKVTAALKILTGDAREPRARHPVQHLRRHHALRRRRERHRRLAAGSPLDVPLVIRLTGTNEEKARQILKENGLGATTSMDEAVAW
jgi:succinyl-CoA synthetase beta subunit